MSESKQQNTANGQPNSSGKPEYHEHEEFINRNRKLLEIKVLGITPYPHQYSPSAKIKELHDKYTGVEIGFSEEAEAGKTPQYTVAGRLVLFRAMGKNAFCHLQDGSGRLQVMFNRDFTAIEGYNPQEGNAEAPRALKILEKLFDLGDIVGVEGHLFFTHKGELTLYAKKVTLLCKTLLPLADKHSGLNDKELRYRKRWLDLISNQDIADTFRARSLILKKTREFFDRHQFMEVETPVLQSVYGGAEARPFVTTLNALHQEMFLRISLELPLKKLIVGGMDRIFEIGRVFRNEGIDRNHNPEFTMLEAYASHWDYNQMMVLVETLFETLALELYGKTQIPATVSAADGAKHEISLELKAPWPRMSMAEAIKTYGHIDIDQLTDQQMGQLLLESKQCAPEKLKLMSRGLLVGALFEVFAEPHLIQPHHIIDHPIETTPLCKPHRDPAKAQKGLVERFESFILASEICNAYTELNDPVIQRELLEKQAKRRDAGDEEAAPLDEEFIEAICQGMPPCGGVGIGIDRMLMILLNQHSIRDVLYFPWMKPQQEAEG